MGVRIVIRGSRVQEVGYRLFLLKEAERLGVRRFQAENIEDYVEVLADGPREALEKFIDYVKTRRPLHAQVESIEVEEFKDSIMEIEAYYRLLQTEQLYKIAEIGVRMLGGQEELIEGQRRIAGEIRELREDLKTMVMERISRIEADVAKIKAKLGID
mgnify:CR=1 FL=1